MSPKDKDEMMLALVKFAGAIILGIVIVIGVQKVLLLLSYLSLSL